MSNTTKQEIRARNRAVTAFNMKQEGYTTNEIAKVLSLKPHQVKTTVLRGERIASLSEET